MPRRTPLTIILAAVLALLAGVGPLAAPTLAHSALVRSFPGAGAVLQESPQQVRLWFNENLTGGLSAVVVTDAAGERVDRDNTHLSLVEANRLQVDLDPLADGEYTVSWRTTSADGHPVTGIFRFRVDAQAAGATAPGATPDPGAAAIAPDAGPGAADGRLPWAKAAVHWLVFIMLALIIGYQMFVLRVLDPVARQLAPAGATADAPAGVPDGVPAGVPAGAGHAVTSAWVARHHSWYTWTGTVALLLTHLADLAIQSAWVGQVGITEVFSQGVLRSVLFDTAYGILWLVRVALVLALAAVLLRRRPGTRVSSAPPVAPAPSAAPAQIPAVTWAEVLLASGVLLAQAISGHGATGKLQAALLSSGIHLYAVSVWLGGSFWLGLWCWRQPERLSAEAWSELNRSVLRRFAPLAGLGAALVLLSGLYAVWLNIPDAYSLTATLYGRTLVWKLAAAAALAALLAVHRRRLWRSAGGLWAEAAAGALVLLLAALLTNLTPAAWDPSYAGSTAAQTAAGFAADAGPFRAGQSVGAVQVTLTIDPNRAGWNYVDVVLVDGHEPVEGAEVFLKTVALDHGRATELVGMAGKGNGYYSAQGNHLRTAGRWEVAVVIERPGRDPIEAIFSVPVGESEKGGHH